MNYKVFPNNLAGRINAPSSKSYSHRALICASMAKEDTVIHNFLYCLDTIATINCLKALGVKIICEPDVVVVKGGTNFKLQGRLDAQDSASTIRMLIPLISCFITSYNFYASKKLLSRLDTNDICDLGLNIIIKKDHLEVSGELHDITLSTKNTSQWLSGLLFILPLKKIKLTVDDYHNPYNLMTIAMQKVFKVEIDDKFNYQSGYYTGTTLTIDTDYSNLSNFLVMKYLGNDIIIDNIKQTMIQGDTAIVDILNKLKMDAKPIFMMHSNPDLIPILAFACALTKKESHIYGLEKLTKKESNRILSTYQTLKKMGVNIKLTNNFFIIHGQDKLLGGKKLSSYGDHRIVMALIAVSSKVDKPFLIKHGEVIQKSSPEFMDVFSNLGGKYESKI